jgi:hypothetical protein
VQHRHPNGGINFTVRKKASAPMHSHVCEKCNETFSSNRSRQRFCSADCRHDPNRSTANQYAKIDGNIPLYLNRLLYKGNHLEGKSRKNLTLDQLITKWKDQDGRCAVSGIPMTYRAVIGGEFPFNASIDCIIPRSKGGQYAIGNIRLICTIVNVARQDYSDGALEEMCIAIAGKLQERPSRPMSHPWVNSMSKSEDAFANFPRRVPLTGISELAVGIDMSKEYQMAAHLAELDYLAHEIAVKRAMAPAA